MGGIPHLYVGQTTKKETSVIPGPASVLQAALLRKHADVMEGVVVYLHAEGVMAFICLGDMKKYCKNGKLELVVGVIMSCTPNTLGDLTVTLKDSLGTMGSTIHYKVFNEENGYASSIKVGVVLILRNVSIFTPNPSKHYLNITSRNIVK
nr:hypothetical protein [Tanacetum cinerariifolium]